MVVDKAFCGFFEKNAKLLAIFFVVWKMFHTFAHKVCEDANARQSENPFSVALAEPHP